MLEKFKIWMANRLIGDLPSKESLKDASAASREIATGLVKRVGFRNGDVTSGDFEEAEFDLAIITEAYNTDSYIRQGVDKYIDQIFKDGYRFYGKDPAIIEYLEQRFNYMAEATGLPFEVFLMEIAEDVVKFSNCLVAKVRSDDPLLLPPNANITGINDQAPIVGYFPLNVTQFNVKRDENGTVEEWQQEVESSGDTVEFSAEEIIHFYYKREKGNAFGTPFLVPVLDDVRALRQAEENVLKMMYRNIYPFFHVQVGSDDLPGSDTEIAAVEEAINDMEVDGGLVTTNRVKISPIASNQVIDASPYLAYLEERVFSGMGVPAVLFGRGNTANRSTSESMASEMSDRINAIQHNIEVFFNNYIIKELLLEAGYDYITNPDHLVEFKFNDSDYDTKIKKETHAIYQYEHNAITEDEMRNELGRDPITDRSLMHQTLITQANVTHEASVKGTSKGTGATETSSSAGTKETNNKQTPTNQSGTKTSPKKQTNEYSEFVGLVKDRCEQVSVSPSELPTFIANERQELTAILDWLISKESADYEKGLSQINKMMDRLEELTNETLEAEMLTQRIAKQYDRFGQ